METLSPLKFKCAMTRTNRGGERVATGFLNKFDGFLRIGQKRASLVHFDVFFYSAEPS